MYKRIFIISIFLIIINALIFLDQRDSKQDSNNIETSIKYFNKNVLTDTNQFKGCFSNRYITIKNDEICIGKSKNELDNGYFDIKLKITENVITIYINKLFKEFDEGIICDEIYVTELVEYITKVFNLKIDKIQFSQIIIYNYEKLRDIDRSAVENVDKTVEISGINITITLWQNMLLLKMGDK